jgi:phosphohistidine phosphatase
MSHESHLLLWRHAEAEEGLPDLSRALTRRGRRQADTMAAWLRPRLPQRWRLLASPAVRTMQTARALTDAVTVDERLAPDASVDAYLAVIGWAAGDQSTDETSETANGGVGDARGALLVVGHQPLLGGVAGRLLSGLERDFSVRKGAVWWLLHRERQGAVEIVLRAVVDPAQL